MDFTNARDLLVEDTGWRLLSEKLFLTWSSSDWAGNGIYCWDSGLFRSWRTTATKQQQTRYVNKSILCFVSSIHLFLSYYLWDSALLIYLPGFIALAQLPLIFLLALKSPLPLQIYLPTLSYTHYNFLHRWAGRTMFLCVTVHGGIWLNQFIYYGEWDEVWADKTTRGMLAYGLMGMMVLTSLKPFRRRFYQVFWIVQWVLPFPFTNGWEKY